MPAMTSRKRTSLSRGGARDWSLVAVSWLLALPSLRAADLNAPASVADLPPVSPAAAQAQAAAVPTPAAAQLTRADAEAWLDGFLPHTLGGGDIAGAVVVVVKDGRILLQKGYGYSDVARKAPVNPQRTLFRPGSISKLFTWTAAMQLVEQGKLDLDRDINDYLDFKITPAFGNPITLRHLLTHTPGFEETVKEFYLYDPRKLEPLDVYVKRHTPKRIYPPGAIAAYSNYGTTLAGYIVQRVSGERFEEYIERHIFRPLDMASSSFYQPLPPPLAALMSQGYERASAAPGPFEIFGPNPAGALSASATDIAHFMIAHLQQGGYEGRSILQPATIRMMHTFRSPSTPAALNSMLLGFYQIDRNGRRIIGHGGDTEFFHSHVNLYLDENVGIFLSFNSKGESGAVYSARTALVDGFTDRYFPPLSRGERDSQQQTMPTAAEHARMAEGLYEPSRRFETTFLSPVIALTQTRVSADSSGILEVSSLLAPNDRPKRWREVGSFVWQEIDGQDRLVMTIEGGRVTAIRESDDPATVLLRAPVWRASSWSLPLLLSSLSILLMTVIAWPIAALIRRHYGAPLKLNQHEAFAYRGVRVAALANMVFLAGWLVVLQPLLSNGLDFFSASVDPWFQVLRVMGLLVVAAALVAIWSAWQTCRGRRGWVAKTWSVLLALVCVAFLWFASIFHWIGFSLNY